ncbi:MAG: queA [Gammaproteobacteria bacterium]|nr:queA [Gammaproteobacteria bacterium]
MAVVAFGEKCGPILLPCRAMLRSEFTYDLPEELIAQYPPPVRGESRLLHLDMTSGDVHDGVFADLVTMLHPGDMLVFNDTRVIPARLFGSKETGGKVEILIERLIGKGKLLGQIRASKSPRIGSRLLLENGKKLQVIGRQDEFFLLAVEDQTALTGILEEAGHVPLPPYIRRVDGPLDRERYQTVFARHAGAVAAPTAGLHFTPALLQRIRDRGCATGFVTLHVGAGTFQPVRAKHIEDHHMHNEYFEIDAELCESISRTRQSGGRVVAVGTTTARVLETAALTGTLIPQQGETNIFIYPGFRFRMVDAMLTNFHLPESTLLMLVCAFAGTEQVLTAYRHAVREQYRFFSYGDAMLIDKTVTSDK